MARSTYVYLVHDLPSGLILAAYTVRYELINDATFRGWKPSIKVGYTHVLRMRDGVPTEPVYQYTYAELWPNEG